MNNYITFLTNFVQNFGIFYISHKFNKLFGEKSDRIVSWNYIGRVKLPEKFITKYHTKINKIVLYDYSEDFIKNKLFNYDIKIDSNIDYLMFKKYSEDFMIFILLNAKRYHLSYKKILSNYPFSYKTFEKYNFLADKNLDILNITVKDYTDKYYTNYDISKFENDDIKKIISNFSKIDIDNRLELDRTTTLISLLIKDKKINKQIRKMIIIEHTYLATNFWFYADLLKFQYLTPEEIKLIKKLLEEKSNDSNATSILKTYFNDKI